MVLADHRFGSGYGAGYGSGYGFGDGDGSGSSYGFGYGDDYGSGSGYGDGYGSGYGSGYGDGSGYGFGYGDGYGSDSGSGYGDGSGSGSGYGEDYGSGYGSGDDVKEYFSEILAPHITNAGTVAFWRSTQDGRPANGGTGPPRKVGTIETTSGTLSLCGAMALHATLKPSEWKGERWWIVRLSYPVIGDNNKLASQRREILRDLGPCPF